MYSKAINVILIELEKQLCTHTLKEKWNASILHILANSFLKEILNFKNKIKEKEFLEILVTICNKMFILFRFYYEIFLVSIAHVTIGFYSFHIQSISNSHSADALVWNPESSNPAKWHFLFLFYSKL